MGRRAASLLAITGLGFVLWLNTPGAFGALERSKMSITVWTTEDAADKADKIAAASKTLPDAEVGRVQNQIPVQLQGVLFFFFSPE